MKKTEMIDEILNQVKDKGCTSLEDILKEVLLNDIDIAIKALEKYGKHFSECKLDAVCNPEEHFDKWKEYSPNVCTCGFTETIKQIKGE